MRTMFKWLSKLFSVRTHAGLSKQEEKWLAESSDLVELEQRIKRLENINLKGWI